MKENFKGLKLLLVVETFLSRCDKRFHNEMNLCWQTIAPTTKLTSFTSICEDVHAKSNSYVNKKEQYFCLIALKLDYYLLNYCNVSLLQNVYWLHIFHYNLNFLFIVMHLLYYYVHYWLICYWWLSSKYVQICICIYIPTVSVTNILTQLCSTSLPTTATLFHCTFLPYNTSPPSAISVIA